MNVPILLHHLRNASGIVLRVQTEVEFLYLGRKGRKGRKVEKWEEGEK